MEVENINKYYGFNKIIKKYIHYNSILPLPATLQHGWGMYKNYNIYELSTSLPEVWVWSKRVADEFKKIKHNKIIRIIGSPILYLSSRKLSNKNIIKRGTIVFPQHCSVSQDSIGDFEKYAYQLSQLPKIYFPITVCLYFIDIEKGYDKYYRKYNFNIISNGKTTTGNFLANFIKNTASYKYATSNSISTACFYSIYLGLRYFHYGDKFKIYNHSNNFRKKGIIDIENHNFIKKLEKIWAMKYVNKNNKIKIAYRELGVKYKITKLELHRMILNTNKQLPNCIRKCDRNIIRKLAYEIYKESSEAREKGYCNKAMEGYRFLTRDLIDINDYRFYKKYISGSFYHIAKIYLSHGEEIKAVNCLNKCIEIEDNHKMAKYLLNRIKCSKKKLK